MNITKKLSFILVLTASSISSLSALGKFSMDRIYSLFGKYQHENVSEKEYHIAKPATLTINNLDGDITITTEWKRNTIHIRAITKAAKEEDLKTFSVNAQRKEEFDGNHLNLQTVCSSKEAKGAVHYQLIVPSEIALNLHTDRGNIKIHDVHGQVVANTQFGDIDIKNVSNIVTAQTEENGSINIEKALGNVKATTNKGNISITDAAQSIIASTTKGHITTACTQVPSTSKIVLNSESSGSITLAMPSSVNATLQGKTAKGRLTSDHYITLKPITTKLTSQTRKELARQVDGILGTGEADIRLSSNSGNIKITQTKSA